MFRSQGIAMKMYADHDEILCYFLEVLFTVEAEQTKYKGEFGGQVEMGCKFSPKPSHPNSDLKVTWRWITATPYQEVIRIENRIANSASQKYQGRVKLLMNELNDGWAKLQVSTCGNMTPHLWIS